MCAFLPHSISMINYFFFSFNNIVCNLCCSGTADYAFKIWLIKLIWKLYRFVFPWRVHQIRVEWRGSPWWRKFCRLARWCHLFPWSAYSALNEIIVTAAWTCRAMRIDIPNHRPEVRMRVRGCLLLTPSTHFDRPNETFSCCRYGNDARQRTMTTHSVCGTEVPLVGTSIVSLSIHRDISDDTKILYDSDNKQLERFIRYQKNIIVYIKRKK